MTFASSVTLSVSTIQPFLRTSANPHSVLLYPDRRNAHERCGPPRVESRAEYIRIACNRTRGTAQIHAHRTEVTETLTQGTRPLRRRIGSGGRGSLAEQ